MALLTTALGLYGGVLWSGKLQGFSPPVEISGLIAT
jgi:hypothetical protein